MAYARDHLGVEVIFMTQEESEKYSVPESVVYYDAPFCFGLGIEVRKSKARIVAVTDYDPNILGSVIHELGHICVTGNTSEDEFIFFGWEFAVACAAGLLDEWLESSRDYSVTERGDEFGHLDEDEQTACLEERLSFAEERGYVVGGVPQRMRKRFSNSKSHRYFKNLEHVGGSRPFKVTHVMHKNGYVESF